MAELDNATSLNASHGNDTDGHTVTYHASGHPEPTPIIFIFGACALGALVRTVLSTKIRLPYTVVLLILGALLGVLSSNVPVVRFYTTVASMDPHTILHAFLPVLIFESAFAMEAHTFFKSFMQIIVLALPGLALAALLTALFSMHVFSYNWDWPVAMMFGSIASATDPVAVVALLKELGASKTLGIVIEGESLLNDGAAIVMFDVFRTLSTPGKTMSGLDIFLVFLTKAIAGPVFGFLMARITVFWLVNIFNDALTEITITLAATYVTFYVGEAWLQVSGVLAVVVLGVTLSAERTSISPEVETFLHRFWEMLAYLANTLIFILVGVVITEKAIDNTTGNDWFLLIALYVAVFIIRALVIALFMPVLQRIGYGLTWRSAIVMTWGGLRGAVGLALALIVSQDHSLDPTGVTQDKILLHSAGLVMLTLTINATTVSPLLRILGMSEISMPKRMAMASAVRNLQEVVDSSITLYKSDRFLADADWDVVKTFGVVTDPYQTLDEEASLEHLTNWQRTSQCPVCATKVPNEPSPKEWEEMQQEAQLRLLKAQKKSYWHQFEHGMLSRDAVGRLVELVDNAADKAEYIDYSEVKLNWSIRGIYAYLKAKLEHWQSNKPDESVVAVPQNKVLRIAYRICVNAAFEVILYSIIMANVVVVIVEVVAEATLCKEDYQTRYGISFDITNYIFITLYIIEAVLKITAFGKYYFHSRWNLFDFVILLLSIVDLALELGLLQETIAGLDCSEEASGSGASSLINPNLLKVIKAVRLLRLLRSLRLVKGLIPQVIDVLNHRINKQLRLGYDVGKGYITGQEDVHNYIDNMIDNTKIADELKENVVKSRLVIMKELGLLQKRNPGIAVSIKTQQATRRILNHLRDKITALKGEGVLDEGEADKLGMIVEVQMKKLLKIPATIQPPPPDKIVGNLSWVGGDEHITQYIKHNARLVSLQEGELIDVESDTQAGIYIIISGLVKVDKIVEDNTPPSKEDYTQRRKITMMHSLMGNGLPGEAGPGLVGNKEKFSDYLTTGNLLGELALLTGKTSQTTATCDTSVQMYHISYDAIQGALEMFTEAPSLEYRLWRVAASGIAAPLMKKNSNFRNWSQDQIKLHLEKCVLYLKKWEVPPGGKFTKTYTFDIANMFMSDVILIHGYVANQMTGEVYIGPCYLPSSCECINLIPEKTEKHVLLIVPRDPSVKLEKTTSSSNLGTHEVAILDPGGAQTAADDDDSGEFCLRHAAEQRHELEERISDTKLVNSQLSLVYSMSNKVLSVAHMPAAEVDIGFTEQALQEDLERVGSLSRANLARGSGPSLQDGAKNKTTKKKVKANKVFPTVTIKSEDHLPPVERPEYRVLETTSDGQPASTNTANTHA